MKLKEGKSYVDRTGSVVTITRRKNGLATTYPFIGNNNRLYMENGQYVDDSQYSEFDLIKLADEG